MEPFSRKENGKKIRQAAVAGLFYPLEKSELKKTIQEYLQSLERSKKASNSSKMGDEKVRGILVPHAGYDFSGKVAANAYLCVNDLEISTVILVGCSHQSYFSGAVIDDNDIWQTPLGSVELDRKLGDKLVSLNPFLAYDSTAHAKEHSLEVQVPFLQTVLKTGFKILPVLIGQESSEKSRKLLVKFLSEIIYKNLGKTCLLVVSTDLSHYPKYEDARKIDNKTIDLIQELDIATLEKHVNETMELGVSNEETCACGLDAIEVLMGIAQAGAWRGKIVEYANSGDVAMGNKDRVVGYASMVFFESGKAVDKPNLKSSDVKNVLSETQGKTLLKIARNSVEEFCRTGRKIKIEITDNQLLQKQGAFVTIHMNKQLRGCIGQIIPNEKPLWQVVQDMAIQAGFDDPRFRLVAREELSELEYEISVLTEPEQIFDWRNIKLGEQGVIIRKGDQGGVFLPQVAQETGWKLEKFLEVLCTEKAGLPFDAFKNDKEVKLFVFSAQVFYEEDN